MAKAKRRLVRLPEVMRRVGYSRPSIYKKINTKEFPAPVNLGGRAVAWIESDIDAWIESRINSRPLPNPSSASALALGTQGVAA